MKRAIFFQYSNWNQVTNYGVKKFQWLYKFSVYAIFFIATYLTIHFLNYSINDIIASPGAWINYVPKIIMQFFHTTLMSYFLSQAFLRLYQNHKKFKYYLVWFVIYIISGILVYGLWFHFQNNYYSDGLNPSHKNQFGLIYLNYFFYFLMYLVFVEAAYTTYLLLTSSKINPAHVQFWKFKLTKLIVLFIYLLGFSFFFINESSFNYRVATIVNYYRFIDADKIVVTIVVSFLILVPWIFFGFFSIFVRRFSPRKSQSFGFQNQIIVIYAMANFLYFIVKTLEKETLAFNEGNKIFLAIAIILFLVLIVLLAINYLNFNSGALFYSNVYFILTIMNICLIILNISFDVANISSQTNSLILAFFSFFIFGSIMFTKYNINKTEKIIFGLNSSLFSALFFTLIYLNESASSINLSVFDPYLLMYSLMAIFTLINFNVFLIIFIKSLKRLSKISNFKIKKQPISLNLNI